MAENISSEERSLLSLKRVNKLVLIWACVVIFILLIQAYFYNGLYARVAEWQFSKFERLFPFSSLFLIAFILSLPLLILYAVRKRRHRRLYGEPVNADRLRDIQKKFNFLSVITIGAVLATLLVFILSLRVTDHSNREVQTITALDPIMQDGPVVLEANVLYNRLASYSQKTLLTRNQVMLAPLRFNETDTTLRHFVMVNGKNKAGPMQFEAVKGYARKTRLPGGFRVLYGNSGYTVDKDTYVIHPSAASAHKRRFGLAETLARLSFWLFLALLLVYAYRRRLKREHQDSVNPVV